MAFLFSNLKATITYILFFLLCLWWLLLKYTQLDAQLSHNTFSDTYGIIALIGGLWGLGIAKGWGHFKSVMGKSIIFLSLGLIAQFVGQIFYTYYFYVLHVDVPYPSLGDIGYFGSIPLYALGVWYLAKASGSSFSLKKSLGKIQVVAVPIVLLLVSYFIFLQGYEFNGADPLTVALDFGYPFGEAIYISIALLAYLLSWKILGGVMQQRVMMILMALLVQYIADFTFLYQAKMDTWIAGDINDLMYLISYFTMTLALLQMNIKNVTNHIDKGEGA